MFIFVKKIKKKLHRVQVDPFEPVRTRSAPLLFVGASNDIRPITVQQNEIEVTCPRLQTQRHNFISGVTTLSKLKQPFSKNRPFHTNRYLDIMTAQTDISTLALHNKVAIVTGASRGIGAGLALDLARKGAKVP
jgi:3-oxoacyl-ACP reductase-like protein